MSALIRDYNIKTLYTVTIRYESAGSALADPYLAIAEARSPEYSVSSPSVPEYVLRDVADESVRVTTTGHFAYTVSYVLAADAQPLAPAAEETINPSETPPAETISVPESSPSAEVTPEDSATPTPESSPVVEGTSVPETSADPNTSPAPSETPIAEGTPTPEPSPEASPTLEPGISPVENPVPETPALTAEQEALVGVPLTRSSFLMMRSMILAGDLPGLYYVTIKYVEAGTTTSVAPDYLAIIKEGEALTVTSPDVLGYVTTVKTVDVPSTTMGSFERTVEYSKTLYNYTVSHQQEMLAGGSFVTAETETLSGVEGNLTQAAAKVYPGFREYPIDQATIPADNSLVVPVKYWRVRYPISFNTGVEGSAVNSVTRLFGETLDTSILPAEPTRPGYLFGGWDWNGAEAGLGTMPATMPANAVIAEAVWNPDPMTSFAVLYWVQNPNDNLYSPIALHTGGKGMTGQIAPADYLSAGGTFNYSAATAPSGSGTPSYSLSDLQTYFHPKTIEQAPISGDGTTIVNAYYDRNTYIFRMQTHVFRRASGTADYYEQSGLGLHNYVEVPGIRYEADISAFYIDVPPLSMIDDASPYSSSWFTSPYFTFAYGKLYWGNPMHVLFNYWTDYTGRELMSPEFTLHKGIINLATQSADFLATWRQVEGFKRAAIYYYENINSTNPNTWSNYSFGGYDLVRGEWTEAAAPPMVGFTVKLPALHPGVIDNTKSQVWELSSSEIPYHYDANGNKVYADVSYGFIFHYIRNNVTITFDYNGAPPTGITSLTLKYGAPLPSLPVPTREGHVFKGWFREQAPDYANPGSSAFTDTTMPAQDIRIFAGWEIQNLEQKLYLMAGATTPYEIRSYPYGSIPDLPATPTREGYIFTGWKDRATGLAYVPGALTKPQELEATWMTGSQVTYTVNYLLEGTTTPIRASVTRTGAADATVSEPWVYVNGYVPLSKDRVSTTLSYGGTNAINIYYRHVSDVPYVIHYYDNGHYLFGATTAGMQLIPDETIINHGSDYSIITKVNTTTITGYNRVNLTDVVNFSGDVSTNISGKPYEMVFLYNPILTYTATTGGSVSRTQETLISTEPSALGATATPAAGYLFKHWQNSSGTVLSTSASLVPTETMTGGDAGYFSPASFTAVFEADTTLPQIVPIDDKTVTENRLMPAIAVTATDNSGIAPSVSVGGLPAGVSYNAATRQITGTPTVDNWGATEERRAFDVLVTAADGAGNLATEPFKLTVLRDTDGDGIPDETDTDDDNDGILDVNDPNPKVPDTAPPVITRPDDTALLEHAAITPIAISVTDDSYNAQTGAGAPKVSLTGLPTGLIYNAATKRIEGTPRVTNWVDNPDTSYENWRDFTITITATDAAGKTTTQTFVITVNRDTDKDSIADQSKDGLVNDPDDDNDKIPDAPDSNDKVPDTKAPVINAIPNEVYLENTAIPAPGKQIEALDESGYMPSDVEVTGLPAGMNFTYVRNGTQGANDPQYITGQAYGTGSTETDAIVWGATEESRVLTATAKATDAAGNFSTQTFTITIQRDTDKDGTPDITDPDDDNDGIPDGQDPKPKEVDVLAVSVNPATQTVTEHQAIAEITITENKTAAQSLSYSPAGVSGLSVDEVTNKVSGTLTGMTWSNTPGDANYEIQEVTVTIASVYGLAPNQETDSDTLIITVLRDTDKDGIPDVDDPDDDGDGIPDDKDPEPKVADVTPPAAPGIKDVCIMATEITGTGEPGATVTVTFKDGTTATAIVGEDGTWSVDKPASVTLAVGDPIKAYQTDVSGNQSPTTTTYVKEMKDLYQPTVNTEVVERGNPNKTYDITNNITNIADLPTNPDGSAAYTLKDITPAGTVDLNKVGDYTAQLEVTYKDGTMDVVNIPVKVVDTIPPKAPIINQVVAMDKTISGTGEPGATINSVTIDGMPMTLPTDPIVVGPDGTWSVPVPDSTTLATGDVIKVAQNDGTWDSPAGETTVVSMATAYTPKGIDETAEKGTAFADIVLTDNLVATSVPAGAVVESAASTSYQADKVGDYPATLTVQYPDGSTDDVIITVKVVDTEAPAAPAINPFYSDDKAITGTGEAGSTVTVTLPNGTTLSAPVNASGSWSVPVPAGTTPASLYGTGSNKITASLKDAFGNVSTASETPVLGMADKYAPVTTNETINIGGTYDLDDNVTGYQEAAGTAVTLSPLPTVEDSTTATIDVNTGGTYPGLVDVTYADGSKDTAVPVSVIVKDLTAPEAPVIDPVFTNNTAITGTGEPGATVSVTIPGVTDPVTALVNNEGNWSVPVPTGTTLKEGDIIKATQKDTGGNVSPEASTTVTTMAAYYQPETSLETVERGDPNKTYNIKDNIRNTADLPAGIVVTDVTTTADPAGDVNLNVANPEGETYTGKIHVAYPDGSSVVFDVPVKVQDTIAPKAPDINPITAHDRTITGTGEPGATVSVTIPGVTDPVTAVVGGDGTWTATVPTGHDIKGGDVIKATQSDGFNTSPEATETANYMNGVYVPSASTEFVEKGTTFNPNTMLDNIDLTKLPAGTAVTDPSPSTLDTSKTGSYTGTVVVNYPDGTFETVNVPISVVDTTPPEAPAITGPVYNDATSITGTGEPGSTVTVTYPNGTTATAPVGMDSKWTVQVPETVTLTKDDVISATQKDGAGNVSNPGTATVVNRPMNELYTPLASTEYVAQGGTYDLTDNITGVPADAIASIIDVTPTAPETGFIDVNTLGNYTGKVEITYTDGTKETVDVPVVVRDETKPLPPNIDQTVALDTTISGTGGAPGGTVWLTIEKVDDLGNPISTYTADLVVSSTDGTWELTTLPDEITLEAGDIIKATQTSAAGIDAEGFNQTTVISMAAAYTPTVSMEELEWKNPHQSSTNNFPDAYLLDNIKNAESLPLRVGTGENAPVTLVEDVSRDAIGDFTGKVMVHYKDGSSEEVTVPVQVRDTTAPLTPLTTSMYKGDTVMTGTVLEPGIKVIYTDYTGEVKGKVLGTAYASETPDASGEFPYTITLADGIMADKVHIQAEDLAGKVSSLRIDIVKAATEKYNPGATDETVELGGTFNLLDNLTNMPADSRVVKDKEDVTGQLLTIDGVPTQTKAIDVNKLSTTDEPHQMGYVLVTYVDDSTDLVPVKVIVKDTTPPAAPEINPITTGDKTITGTGEVGATVTVKFPDGTTATSDVIGTDGKWTVNVPEGTTPLEGGDKVTATQTDPSNNASKQTEATVQSLADKYTPATQRVYVERGTVLDTYKDAFVKGITNLATLPENTTVAWKNNGNVDPAVLGSDYYATVTVTYPDYSAEDVKIPVTVRDTIPPAAPVINQITAHDKTVSGTGEEGSIITVTFPGGGTATATVTDGKWTVDVPEGLTLVKDHIVTAQASDGTNNSTVTNATVQSMAQAYEPTVKAEEVALGGTYNLIDDNITNAGTLPLITETDTVKPLKDTTPTDTIDTAVEGDYTGKVTVTYKDGSTDEVDVPVIVRDTAAPAAPVINQPTALDKTVSGTGGEAGATVTVTFPNGETATSSVIGADGKWTVDVPDGTTLAKDDELKATQKDGSIAGNVSPEATATVQSMADKYAPTAKDEVLERGTGVINLTDNLYQTDLPLKAQPDGIVATNPAGFDINVVKTYEGTAGGSLLLTYQDGSEDRVPVKVIVQDTIPPAAPKIDQITAHDTTVSGTGEPGTTVTVTFPQQPGQTEQQTATATVDENGKWTVNVPTDVTLKPDDTVTAIANDGTNDSQITTATVQSMAAKYTPAAAREIVELGGTLTDYTFTDNVTVAGVTVTTDLKDYGDIDVNTSGDHYYATVTVTYPDTSSEDVKVPVTVRDNTRPATPVIDTVTAGDTTITGTGGEPGATLTVTFPDGKTAQVEVTNPDGSWTVNVPEGTTFKKGDTIKAAQTDASNNTSDTGTTIVQSMADKFSPTPKVESNPVTVEVNAPAYPTGVYTVGKDDLNLPIDFPPDAAEGTPGVTYAGTDVSITTVTTVNRIGTVTITYVDGSQDIVNVPVKVQDTTKPVITASNTTLIDGFPMSDAADAKNPYIEVEVTDNSGLKPDLSATGLPAGLDCNPDEMRIDGTPNITNWGTTEEIRPVTTTIIAVDGSGNIAEEKITITILRDTDGDGDPDETDPDDDGDGIPDENDPEPKVKDTTKPQIQVPLDVTVNEKAPITDIIVKATDDSNLILKELRIADLPGELSASALTFTAPNATSTTISATPVITDWKDDAAARVFEESRDYTVTITAIDQAGNTVTETFVITVLRDTDGDTIPDIRDTDDDGDGVPDILDPTPKTGDQRAPDIFINDNKVAGQDISPSLPTAIRVVEKAAVTPIAIKAEDAVPPDLAVTGTGLPGGLSYVSTGSVQNGFNSGYTTGQVEGTPSAITDWADDAVAGTYEESRPFDVPISATDKSGKTSGAMLTIVVQRDTDGDGAPDATDTDDDGDSIPDDKDSEPKNPDKILPTLEAIAPMTIRETETLGVDVAANDNSGIDPAVSILYQPSGVSYDAAKKQIVGTPNITWGLDLNGNPQESRVFPIQVTAMDLSGNKVSVTFELTVLRDTDKDGTPDSLDTDDDGDGIPDDKDDTPKDFTKLAVDLNPTAMTVTERQPITPITITENKAATQTLSLTGGASGLSEADNTITGEVGGLNWSNDKNAAAYERQIVTLTVDSTSGIAGDTDDRDSVAITVLRDTDDDGIPDITDTDDDGDGLPDANDPEPKVADKTAPRITAIADVTMLDGAVFSGIAVEATDDSGLPPALSVTGLPDGLMFDPGTKVISGTADYLFWFGDDDESRSFTVTVTATDGNNNTATETFTITIQRDSDDDKIPDVLDTDDDGDNIPDGLDPEPKIPDTTAPDVPHINPVSDGDTIVTGTGEPGATVHITFPNGSSQNVDVDDKGNWQADVPTGVTLEPGDEIIANQSDISGNTSDDTTIIVDDTTAPGAPHINPVDPADYQITGTGEPGALVSVVVPGLAEPLTGRVTPGGNWTVYLPDGHALETGDVITATQADTSGNISPEASVTVKDVTRPDAPLVFPIWENDTEIVGLGEPGATVTIIYPGGTAQEVDVDEYGMWTADVPSGITLQDGDQLIFKQTDGAGNTSDTIKATVGDETAPDAPVIHPVEPGDTLITGTGEPGAIVTVFFPDGSMDEGRVDADGNWAVPVPEDVTLVEDDVLYADQMDTAFNVSEETEAIVRDNTKPDAPVVDPVEPGDKEITGTGEPGATVSITYPDGSTQQVPVDEKGDWSATVPADQDLKEGDIITVNQTDEAGNTSGNTTVTVSDTTKPKPPVADPVEPGDKEITGTGEPGAAVTITYPDGSSQEVPVDVNGSWKAAVPENQDLKQGDKLSFTQTDAAGNTSDKAELTVSAQVVPVPVVNPVHEGDETIAGTGEPGATVTITYPDGSKQETVVDGKGHWQITPNKPLKAGDVIKAVQTDKKGVSSAAVEVKVQPKTATDTKPQMANALPVIAANYEGSCRIIGTGRPEATITVILPDGTRKITTVSLDGIWKVTSGTSLVAEDIIRVSSWIEGSPRTPEVMSKVLPASPEK